MGAKGQAGYFYTCKQGERIPLGLSIGNSLLYEEQRVQGVTQSHVRGEMQGTTLENKEIIQGTAAPKSYITMSTGEDDDD